MAQAALDPSRNSRMAVARFQRPTVLLAGRNRSQSPSVTSRTRQLDHLPPSPSSTDRYDFECLQRELEKKSGVLMIDNKIIVAQMDDFINEGCLGAGTCSVVYKMKHREYSDFSMAVKHMRRSSHCQEENKRIMMDLNVVTKSCDCPHIVQCLGIFFTMTDVWICMEVMSTCLDKLANLKRQFPEKVLGKITVSIIKALEYLKTTHKVMHRDVKPSNMLLSSKGIVKLCDFGISGKLKDSIARSRQLGCIGYMAPERLDTPTYDVRADVWSLGISLVELATGSFPYKGTEVEFAIMSKIISDPAPTLPHDVLFTNAFRNFVELCLMKKPVHRPKYRSLMTTEFYLQHDVEPANVEEWYRSISGAGLFTSLHSVGSLASASAPRDLADKDRACTSPVDPSAFRTAASSPASTATLSPEIARMFPGQSTATSTMSRDGGDASDSEARSDSVTSDGPNNQAIPSSNSAGTITNSSQAAQPLPPSSPPTAAPASVKIERAAFSGMLNGAEMSTNSKIKPAQQGEPPSHAPVVNNGALKQHNGGGSSHRPYRSQASSGYGSAGSDSSPGSLGSQSRSPSTFCLLDPPPGVSGLQQASHESLTVSLSSRSSTGIDSGVVSSESNSAMFSNPPMLLSPPAKRASPVAGMSQVAALTARLTPSNGLNTGEGQHLGESDDLNSTVTTPTPSNCTFSRNARLNYTISSPPSSPRHLSAKNSGYQQRDSQGSTQATPIYHQQQRQSQHQLPTIPQGSQEDLMEAKGGDSSVLSCPSTSVIKHRPMSPPVSSMQFLTFGANQLRSSQTSTTSAPSARSSQASTGGSSDAPSHSSATPHKRSTSVGRQVMRVPARRLVVQNPASGETNNNGINLNIDMRRQPLSPRSPKSLVPRQLIRPNPPFQPALSNPLAFDAQSTVGPHRSAVPLDGRSLAYQPDNPNREYHNQYYYYYYSRANATSAVGNNQGLQSTPPQPLPRVNSWVPSTATNCSRALPATPSNQSGHDVVMRSHPGCVRQYASPQFLNSTATSSPLPSASRSPVTMSGNLNYRHPAATPTSSSSSALSNSRPQQPLRCASSQSVLAPQVRDSRVAAPFMGCGQPTHYGAIGRSPKAFFQQHQQVQKHQPRVFVNRSRQHSQTPSDSETLTNSPVLMMPSGVGCLTSRSGPADEIEHRSISQPPRLRNKPVTFETNI